MLFILFAVSLWAGIQNALAGGGAFLTLPALMLSGLDARLANITSTLAVFPGQVTMGLVGRRDVSGIGRLSFRTLIIISLVGGGVGAFLLVATPSDIFKDMVPWLVLFATVLFAYGSFFHNAGTTGVHLGPRIVAALQFAIAVYGGYFGGGIGFLMLAALTAAGLAVRAAGATKNALAAILNFAAVLVLAFTPGLPWMSIGVMAAGAILGGYIGASLLREVDERLIRVFVVCLGVFLSIGLFFNASR